MHRLRNQRIINSEIAFWRNVLQRLISITLFLAKNNLAFRGSSDKLFTDHNGNFLCLVELLGKYDDVMRKHLKRGVRKEVKDHYCSKRIKNELLDIMASKVLKNILMRLCKAKFYSVIVDCTSDISHIEQMSLTVRFVDDSDDQIKVKEHCFNPVDDSTRKGLTELFRNILNENKIMLEHCGGQGYDNGANMKAKHSGVQARILALNPRAFFVPCGCHSLNRVVSDAALSSLDSVTLFGLLQKIYILFSASTIRWKVLTNNVRKLTVKPLSDTHWESRMDSVKTVRFQVTDIYDALMELAQLSKADAGVRHEAQSLANQITDFKFLVSLVVWHNISFQINIVSKTLQNKSVDIVTATSLMKGCIQLFVGYRDNGFENAIIAAKEMAADLVLSLPSRRSVFVKERGS
ncbi:zinc finger MYM-type protein 1-like [Ambystoma mexicanum]|uniref:zinc finger MYM-type protein 1-like n=1 Tax=Ambystoma mexicanum TaxID=8296 RepID=UPI0037E816D9